LSSAARLVLGVLAAHAVHCGILADVCNWAETFSEVS
jgi:hypothetical protein